MQSNTSLSIDLYPTQCATAPQSASNSAGGAGQDLFRRAVLSGGQKRTFGDSPDS